MGLTLIAVLTAALLLPGILAARSFYQAGQTTEVEPTMPSLSTTDGVALVGMFSVLAHVVYALGLHIAVSWPAAIDWPLANPYILFSSDRLQAVTLDDILSMFWGLTLLCLTAMVVGRVAGAIMMRFGDKTIFYGPLGEILSTATGDDDFVTAYVLTKIEAEGKAIGYQGTVASLLRDADRFPTKVVLKDASVFFLDLTTDAPERRETAKRIDWIALSADDWHNIAFRVFKVVDDADFAADGEAVD